MVLPTEATEIFSSMMGCIFYAIVYIIYFLSNNIPFPSSLGPVYQKEVKWSAFNMIFHSHAHTNNSFSQERLCLGLIRKVRVFGTFFLEGSLSKWRLCSKEVCEKHEFVYMS